MQLLFTVVKRTNARKVSLQSGDNPPSLEDLAAIALFCERYIRVVTENRGKESNADAKPD